MVVVGVEDRTALIPLNLCHQVVSAAPRAAAAQVETTVVAGEEEEEELAEEEDSTKTRRLWAPGQLTRTPTMRSNFIIFSSSYTRRTHEASRVGWAEDRRAACHPTGAAIPAAVTPLPSSAKTGCPRDRSASDDV